MGSYVLDSRILKMTRVNALDRQIITKNKETKAEISFSLRCSNKWDEKGS